MVYESTRGSESGLTFSQVIKKGIAEDGGLFVPSTDVQITEEQLKQMVSMSYQDRAVMVLKQFAEDFSEEDFRDCVEKAYSQERFDTEEIAPVKVLSDSLSVLELWHGPTCAFKDMALQILPHFMTKSMKKTGETENIMILVATSGDTGKAALEGFRDVEGTKVAVYFPLEGVSEVQKRQMITQEGKNVDVVAIKGNFDDAQSGVKNIFADPEMAKALADKGYKFSSANSINWGRLLPQIIYYFSAYADLVKKEQIAFGEKINFVVPTGNFGDILAGYYAKKMGLPVNKLICASNTNNVLFDFLCTGTYNKNREFVKTISPAMDILISSNVERLLYDVTGRNAAKVKAWMEDLKNSGVYTVDKQTFRALQEIFWTAWTNEEEIMETISDTYKGFDYLIDTHTAVAVDVYDKYMISTGDLTKTVIVSTASPFKFNNSVAAAVFGEEKVAGKSEFALLEDLSEGTGWQIPKGLKGLDQKPVLHNTVAEKDEMKSALLGLLVK